MFSEIGWLDVCGFCLYLFSVLNVGYPLNICRIQYSILQTMVGHTMRKSGKIGEFTNTISVSLHRVFSGISIKNMFLYTLKYCTLIYQSVIL